MTNLSNAQSLHAVSDEAWAEAVRREAVIRPLAAAPRLSKAAIGVAARALGLSAPRVNGLLRAFRRQPVTASLLPTKPGPMKGTRRLAGAIEAKIDTAIEAVYLKPERPTLRRTLREVRQDCRDAGLTPPSIKALRARVSARSLRERAAARDGTETAGNQFHQVHGGLRTGRPLQIVQIDHTKVDIMLVDDITRACIGRRRAGGVRTGDPPSGAQDHHPGELFSRSSAEFIAISGLEPGPAPPPDADSHDLGPAQRRPAARSQAVLASPAARRSGQARANLSRSALCRNGH
jgi:hypothetical protein